MPSRLLNYEPEIATLFAMPQAARAGGDELEVAASVLDQLGSNALEATLVRLIDDATAAQRPLPRPRALLLATVLGSVARRVLRRRDALRIQAVGRLFNLELEGLSAEDQLFELARSFVRLTRAAARHAALAPAGAAPALVAGRAAQVAARVLAPGLAPLLAAGAPPSQFRRGRDPAVLDSPTPHRLPTAAA